MHNQTKTHASNEEILSDIIEKSFDALEHKNNKYFYYGNINLRKIIERNIYFSGIHNFHYIANLFKQINKDLDNSKEKSEIKYLFSLLDDQIEYISISSFFHSFILSLGIYFRCVIRFILNFKEKRMHKTYAFCADKWRFVHYFSDIIDVLGHENCGFFPINDEVIYAAKKNNYYHFSRGCSLIKITYLKMSPLNYLFIYYLRSVEMVLIISHILLRDKPSFLIFAEGTSGIDATVAIVGNSIGIPTIRMQSGRAGIMHIGYRKMPYKIMLVWGRGFIDRYKPLNPNSTYIITGSPQLDKVKYGEPDKIIESFKNSNYLLAIFTQPHNIHISDDYYRILVEISKIILDKTSNLKIIVRKHPADNCIYFENLEKKYINQLYVTTPDEHSLSSIFLSSEIALGLYSTVLSEAAASGVLPIIVKCNTLGEVFPFPCKENAAICVNNAEDGAKNILKVLNDKNIINKYKPFMNDFSKKYFGPNDGAALTRIVEAINNLSN